MQVRALTRKDILTSKRIESISFLFPLDEEKIQAEIEAGRESADNWWGCFADDGEMAACMINNPLRVRLDGHVVNMGGIGGVASLPEYRYGGAVRSIFQTLLRDARSQGEVLSALYPFSHEFYRKFGYEICLSLPSYCFETSLLAKYKHTGWARKVTQADVSELNQLYEAFTSGYNLAAIRTEQTMWHILEAQPNKNQTFSYVLGTGDSPEAYVCYRMEIEQGRRTLTVRDYAWKNPQAFRMILGLLGRMSADFTETLICLPEDVPFLALVDRPYDVKCEVQVKPMARLTNVEKALTLLKRPDGTAFRIEVDDPFLPENAGIYQVNDEGAKKVEGPADISVSVQTLCQMVLGYLDLNGAEMKADVKIHGNREKLSRVFVRKPMYLADHF